ncbi:Spindle pole body component alp14 [Candida viswanathii]|uniref:Spindle pole body component alp14 n=1 Tax=Candida viswanathii TaxID=5486 RepID=A0A367YJQ8_9ASCO|nr:Spindle pole body component alp14 [Candida viswanathii]
MDDKDEDYSSLSLDEKLVHKVWKVRLQAYDELAAAFEKSRNENDPVFTNFLLDNLKKIILDSNVVAQEAGYNAFVKFLIYGGTVSNVNKLKSLGIVGSICEKGLLSTRKNTKEWSNESLLLMLEITNDPNSIVEDILPYLTNRLPKLVTGCVSGLVSIYENFGCKIISPKPVIPCLSKLFAHADKNVRNETTKLTIELYKWMGDALTNVLFPDLKPVQQKDLTAAFEKEKGNATEQKRLTRKQKEEIERQKELEAAAAAAAAAGPTGGEDVEMTDASGAAQDGDAPAFDPLEFVDPVEVLSKFPSDFDTRISSSLWKDRKAVLEEVVPVLEKSPKLVTHDDYLPVLRVFAKCMKDANIQVVQLAANCIEFIAKGLGREFAKYQTVVLAPVVERLKEKKPSVATALDNVLDAIFNISGFHGGVLDEAVNGMKLKTPQNKIASANFVKRCLSNTKVPPKTAEIDLIMEGGVKLLSESQEPVRQAATEMIGTLMKITGPRELNSFLEKVDENRKSKINDYYEKKAVVKASMGSSRGGGATGAAGTAAPASSSFAKPAAKPQPRASTAATTIPAKRSASSPVKRDDIKTGRGMTARSLTKPNLRPPSASDSQSPPQLPASSNAAQQPPQSASSFEEVTLLKQQIAGLQEDKKNLQHQQELNLKSIHSLEEANKLYQDKIESLKRELDNEKRNALITANHKDTHINNLKLELEKANYKIKDLEQEKEITRLHQSNLAYERGNMGSSHSRSSFYKPGTATSKFMSSDISTGVKRLSIGSEENQSYGNGNGYTSGNGTSNSNSNPSTIVNANSFRSSMNYGTPSVVPTNSRESMDVDNGADWKRAAEVTMQLKARIERMKARTRAPLNIE